MAAYSFASSLLVFLLCFLAFVVDGYVTELLTNQTHPHRIAAFGPRLDDIGIVGVLVPADTLDPTNRLGCHISHGPPNASIPWIALVQKGECSFIQKIRNMQHMGAIAVIVGSDSPQSSLITMQASGDSSDVKIPSVYVLYDSYYDLKRGAQEYYEEYPIYQVKITEFDQIYWPIVNIIIARIVAPALIMVFLYTLAFRCRVRTNEKKRIAKEEMVKNLPTRKWKAKEAQAHANSSTIANEDEHNVCAICLDDYKNNDELRILPCKHEFHVGCIDPWLLMRKKNCPLCKVDAFPDESSNLV